MNELSAIETSPEFETAIARRALALGAENLSRIMGNLDPTQAQILSRGMERVLAPSLGTTPSSRLSADAFQSTPQASASRSKPPVK